jgi:hypothetical protein
MKHVLLYLLCGMIQMNVIAQQPGLTDQTGLEANAYPNPVTSSVNIAISMKKPALVRLKITDLIGKEVYKTSLQQYDAGSHTLNVPMSATSPGVYFFNLIDETGYTTVSGRFVKQ